MPIDPAEWYEAAPDDSALNQGDILDGVPTVVMPPASERWTLLRPAPPVTPAQAFEGITPKSFRPRSETTASSAWADDKELVLARGIKRRILLVNHNCDLDNRKYFQVAPVYPVSALSAGKRASLEVNQIRYLFYLPALPPNLIEDQFADLSEINAVHKSYVRDAKLVRRLSSRAAFELQSHLVRFYGRPFGLGVQDEVIDAGEYVCANCFFLTANREASVATTPGKFPPCPRCGTAAVWLRVPAKPLVH